VFEFICLNRTDNHTIKAIALHLGLDVHKGLITITHAEAGPQGKVHLHGAIPRDLHAQEKPLSRRRVEGKKSAGSGLKAEVQQVLVQTK